MKILVIDNNIDPSFWGSSDIAELIRKTTVNTSIHSTTYIRRAPQGDLPKSPKNFDRVILSGSKTSAFDTSPWVEELLQFVKNTIEAQKPFLGICFGHQMLARALGGTACMGKSKKPEFGWTKINLTADSPLTAQLPKTFYSFSAHFEEVSRLPDNLRPLASSADCSIQACQLEDKPVFGIQFHPEKPISEAKRILQERIKEKKPAQLLNPTHSTQLYNPKIGETLFTNFLNLA